MRLYYLINLQDHAFLLSKRPEILFYQMIISSNQF